MAISACKFTIFKGGCLGHQELLHEFINLLAWQTKRIELSTPNSLTDSSNLAEDWACELLRALHGFTHLRNLNAEKKNFPGIDLADNQARVAIQVTATPGTNKIKETLKTFIAHNLHRHYDRLIVLIITKRQDHYPQDTFNTICGDHLKFDAAGDIWDQRDLVAHARGVSPEILCRAVETLRQYCHPLPSTSAVALPVPLIDQAIEKETQTVRARRFLTEAKRIDEALVLSERLLTGDLQGGSPLVQASALIACAGILVYEKTEETERILSQVTHSERQAENYIIAQAHIEAAKNHQEAAMLQLAKLSSPSSKTAAFNIKRNRESDAEALDWLALVKYSIRDLCGAGKFSYLGACISTARWDAAAAGIDQLVDADYLETPALHHLVAIILLAQATPTEKRGQLPSGVPFQAKNFPLYTSSNYLPFLHGASRHFQAAAANAHALLLPETAHLAEDYDLWIQLRNPETTKEASLRLQASMSDAKHMLRRANLAIQFGLKLNIEKLQEEVDCVTALTDGASVEAACARMALVMVQKNIAAAVAYLDQHREQLYRHLIRAAVDEINIELLLELGQRDDAEARLAMLQKERNLDAQSVADLRRMIDFSNNADPAAMYIETYRQEPSLDHLRMLVAALEAQNDWTRLLPYAKQLVEREPILDAVQSLANALQKNHDIASVVALLERFQDYVWQSDFLASLWGFALYRQGRLKEARATADILLQLHGRRQDRELSQAIYVASGDWDGLNEHVAHEWQQRDKRSASELLQAAQLAQSIGLNRDREFARLAVEKASDEPHVLMGAFDIAVRGGWEDNEEAGHWLHQAIALSNGEGPLKKVTLKEVVAHSETWNQNAEDIHDQLRRGELPMLLAGMVLKKTLAELVLLPALANRQTSDVRQRSAIYAYSGIRQPVALNDIKCIALDATALLSLAMSDMLETALKHYNEIIIPHGTLGWLFEEQQALRFSQPSRIREAQTLQRLVDEGRLLRFSAIAPSLPDLAADIGRELADMLAEAQLAAQTQSHQQLVVCSYPIDHVASLMEETVDLSAWAAHLCSGKAVIDKLYEKGQLTSGEAEHARAYLIAQGDEPWPDEPVIADETVLYLDDLQLHRLARLNLLEKLQAAGLTAQVSPQATAEAQALLRYEHLGEQAGAILSSMREWLMAGMQHGNVRLGPQQVTTNEGGSWHQHPGIAIVKLAGCVDAIVTDDRYINQNRSLSEKQPPTSTLVLTSFDLLNNLQKKGAITLQKKLDIHTTLRRNGLVHFPFDADELRYALTQAVDSQGLFRETAELKSLRESVLLAKMSAALTLPKELPWLNILQTVVTDVLYEQWDGTVPVEMAAARSHWLLPLMDWRGWSPGFTDTETAHRFATNCRLLSLLRMALPLRPMAADYWAWLDQHVFACVKAEEPTLFAGLIQQLEAQLTNFVEHYLDNDETSHDEKTHRTRVATAVLQRFCSPLLNKAVLDPDRSSFASHHALSVEMQITLAGGQTFPKAPLITAIQQAFANPDKPFTIEDNLGGTWTLRADGTSLDDLILKADSDEEGAILSQFWMLLPTAEQRLKALDVYHRRYHLPTAMLQDWQTRLTNPLDDDEIDVLVDDLLDLPLLMREEFLLNAQSRQAKSTVVMPTTKRYLTRLVGEFDGSRTIQAYVESTLKPHIADWQQWDSEQGLRFALHLSSHASIVEAIALDTLDDGRRLDFFNQLAQGIDRLSQLGAIELGLSMLDRFPELADPLTRMIEQIRDDDLQPESSPFCLLSNLSMFTFGEMTRAGLWQDHPPFWRRLAAMTQASLIIRTLAPFKKVNTTFIQWTNERNLWPFYLQSLCDLRTTPAWLPNYLAAEQLKQYFLGRILRAAVKYQHYLTSPELCAVLLPTDVQHIPLKADALKIDYAGPLDGDEDEKAPLPNNIAQVIEEQLSAADIDLSSFIPLVNAAPVYQIDAKFAAKTAQLLQKNHYYLKSKNNQDDFIVALQGLAHLSAVTRNTELSVALKKMFLRAKNVGVNAHQITSKNLFLVGLIAAAAHSDLEAWTSYFSEWANDAAWRITSRDEANQLRGMIDLIARCSPALWSTLGKADAALASITDGG